MNRRLVAPLLLLPLGACAAAPRTDTAALPSASPPPAPAADRLPEVALAPGWTPDSIAAEVARFAPVELDFDESLLDAEGKILVIRLVEASDVLGEIFRRQVWRSNPGYAEKLARAAGPGLDAAREYYAIMAGPWDRLEHDAPFLDVGPKPAGAGLGPTFSRPLLPCIRHRWSRTPRRSGSGAGPRYQRMYVVDGRPRLPSDRPDRPVFVGTYEPILGVDAAVPAPDSPVVIA